MDENVPPGLTIRQAALAMRSGELTPAGLLERSLARIDKWDSHVRAMVEVTPDAASAAAALAAKRLAAGDAAPLCGIPIVVKDIIDIAGLPTRCGSLTRQNVAPASADAAVVSALRAANGVVLGKTVTQEFAAGTLSPPARNPWGLDRVPGGSSGGSAVAVATGMAMVGLGTDTGGSIRNPAALCGVTGLKPTYGAISTDGVYPLAWSLDTVGPLTRTADDAWLTYCAMRRVSDFTEHSIDLAGKRIGLLRGYFIERVTNEVLAAVNAAAEVFRHLGAEVVELEWPEAAAARAVGFLLNRVETVAVHRALLEDGAAGLDLVNPSLRLRLIGGQFVSAVAYLQALGARAGIRDSMARLFNDYRLDAVLAPTAPITAVAADTPSALVDGIAEDANLAYTRLTQPFNATGQPVLSLPCGFDAAGLPIGAQLAGRPWGEQALCAAGHAYQSATNWHSRQSAILDRSRGDHLEHVG